MFSKLPAAFFSGLRVKQLDPSSAEVTVPYFWFSQNPFRSTYFACLAMAAEMSSGLLAMLHVYKSDPAVSMLVLTMKASFHKKAIGKTTFRCEDGEAVAQAVHQAKTTGEGITIETISRGYSTSGELVAEFTITWTFKSKLKS